MYNLGRNLPKMKPKLKLFFPSLILGNLLLLGLLFMSPAAALAQNANVPPVGNSGSNSTANNTPLVPYSGPEGSIKRLLCTPGLSDNGTNTNDQTQGTIRNTNISVIGTTTATSNPTAGDLSLCINRLYKFGGAIGAFAGVFFVALAGYYYILGGEHAKEKAKTMIISVIVGLVIIFTSYILLKFINPESVKFKSIQPPELGNVAALPSCGDLVGAKDCAIDGDGETTDSTGGNGGAGGTVKAGTYTDAQAKALLKGAGIELQSTGIRFDNVQRRVIDELLAVKSASNARMSVGSGTDGTHASGQCSHASGYKVDLNWSSSPDLNKYITGTFKNIGTRGDGAIEYQNASSGAIWNLEPRNGSKHWDVLTKCP